MNTELNIFDEIDINIRWREFMEQTNNRFVNMWNYMAYNNFCEKEIINLKNENYALKQDLEDKSSQVFSLRLKNEKLKSDLNPPSKKRKLNELDELAQEFKKIKKHKKSTP